MSNDELHSCIHAEEFGVVKTNIENLKTKVLSLETQATALEKRERRLSERELLHYTQLSDDLKHTCELLEKYVAQVETFISSIQKVKTSSVTQEMKTETNLNNIKIKHDNIKESVDANTIGLKNLNEQLMKAESFIKGVKWVIGLFTVLYGITRPVAQKMITTFFEFLKSL